MKFKDYYRILGLERGCKPEEIKRAYRRLARKYHPDVSKEPEAEARFKEINEAYQVLGDAEKRRAYDELGTGFRPGQDFSPPPDWAHEFAGGFQGEDLGAFSDFFESLFGARPRGAGTRARRGHDQHARLAVSLEDAVRGATREVQLQVPEIGPDGHVHSRTRTLRLTIPAGVVQGQQIRLAGQGLPGPGGGPPGDLYLEILFRPHPLFKAEGRDIYLNLPVAPWEVALGTKVPVPTLGGKVELQIPAGAQSGQSLRLKGRGLPGSPPGDQYVVLQVVTPKADSQAARALYRRMQQELAFDPRARMGGQA